MEVSETVRRKVKEQRLLKTNEWSPDTFVERPPKEDAMVLNSTCLTSGFPSEASGSLWTI